VNSFGVGQPGFVARWPLNNGKGGWDTFRGGGVKFKNRDEFKRENRMIEEEGKWQVKKSGENCRQGGYEGLPL